MREAGAEGIEMVMWLIMCGALDDKAEEIYRFYAVPTSNTPVGHIILENRSGGVRPAAPKRIEVREGRRAMPVRKGGVAAPPRSSQRWSV
jgi:protocatechuate 4,5-dioxygenase, beta chain